MNVVREQPVLDLGHQQRTGAGAPVSGSRDRFAVGEITRTDDQAGPSSRLAGATVGPHYPGSRRRALFALARATFERDHRPAAGYAGPYRYRSGSCRTLEYGDRPGRDRQSLASSRRSSPSRRRPLIPSYLARSALLPQVSLNAQLARSWEPSATNRPNRRKPPRSRRGSSVPLYPGGRRQFPGPGGRGTPAINGLIQVTTKRRSGDRGSDPFHGSFPDHGTGQHPVASMPRPFGRDRPRRRAAGRRWVGSRHLCWTSSLRGTMSCLGPRRVAARLLRQREP